MEKTKLCFDLIKFCFCKLDSDQVKLVFGADACLESAQILHFQKSIPKSFDSSFAYFLLQEHDMKNSQLLFG